MMNRAKRQSTRNSTPSSSRPHSRPNSKEFNTVCYNELYDSENEGDRTQISNDSTPVQVTGMVENFGTGEFKVYQHVGGISRPPSVAGSQGELCFESGVSFPTKVQQTINTWRLPSASKTRSSTRSSTPSDSSRPITAVKAAGYSSRGDLCFESGVAFPTKVQQTINTWRIPSASKTRSSTRSSTPSDSSRPITAVKAAGYSSRGDQILALEKAQEAVKKEKILNRYREQSGLGEEINMELAFSVNFNLAYKYQLNELYSEALNIYSQIVNNKQFSQGGRLRVNMGNIYYKQAKFPLAIKLYRMALDQTPNSYKETRFRIMRNIGCALMQIGQYEDAIQSFETIMEMKYDHQSGYNLIICYSLLGEIEKMKTCFTKMLLIRHCDPDIDDDIKNDELAREIYTMQNQAHKYIFRAARIIAPIIGDTYVEGYDWVIDLLKKQQYMTMAHEIQMDKAIQFLHKKDFKQAITLLKEFERKEKHLKARAATNLSFLYFLENDIQNARKYVELALTTNHHNAFAIVNKGNCLFYEGNIEGAKELYIEALTIEEHCVQAIYNLGLSYKTLGELPEALNIFKKINKFTSK